MRRIAIFIGLLLSWQSAHAQDNIILYGLDITFSDDIFGGVESIDLLSLNPATGDQSTLLTVDGAQSVAAGSSTYNADQDQYFFWGSDNNNERRFYSLDLNSTNVDSNSTSDDIIVDIEYNYANGKVYGLRLNSASQTNDLDLVEINLKTGESILINDLPNTEGTGQGNSTFDPVNNLFIFLSFNQGAASVIGIDVTNGETAFDTNVDSVEGQVLAFEYDWGNDRLLGIRQTAEIDFSNGFETLINNYLVEIDIETGEVRDISQTPAFQDAGVPIGGVAFDQESGTYITYVDGGSVLGMISGESGQVVNTIELPKLIYEIQVDNFEFAQTFLATRYGDVNLDGAIDLLDVAPFVDILTAGEYQVEADMNSDNVVDLMDVAPFVALIQTN